MSSNIVERCAAVSEALTVTEETEATEFSVEQLAPLASRLRDLHGGLSKQRARAEAGGSTLDERQASAARTALARVRGQLNKDPGLLIRGKTFNGLTDTLGSLVRSTTRTTDEHLTRLQSKWAGVSVEYLELFSTIPRMEEICDEGLELAKELKSVQVSRDTSTAAAVKGFLVKGRRLEQIEAEVNDFPCPDDVRAFLELARKGGAPLAMLGPETKMWLDENDLLDKIKVRLV